MLRSKTAQLIGLTSVFLCVAFLSHSAYAESPLEEAKLDRQIGILNHPWRINLIRIMTRDYLRHQSLTTSGLPSYDKLVTGNTPLNQPEVHDVTITSNSSQQNVSTTNSTASLSIPGGPVPSSTPASSNTTAGSVSSSTPASSNTTAGSVSSSTSASSSIPVVSQPTTGPYQLQQPNLVPIVPLDPTEFN